MASAFGGGMMPRMRPTPQGPPEEKSQFGEIYDKLAKARQEYGKYVNYLIYYGWVPFVIYKGLSHGGHRYMDDKTMQPRQRPPKLTDVFPVIGTHGLP